MCTVTYVPMANDNFIFTSNRDESPKRSATEMAWEVFNGKTVLFPRDALAKGSWIAISDQQQLVCILNGAFQNHKHQPPYKLSRGIMALRFFTYTNASAFFEEFEFEGMEPFTMIIIDKGHLYELRWDAQQKHIIELSMNEPHIWASYTLYPEEWQQKRMLWFEEWLAQNQEIDQGAVLSFHKSAGEGNPEYDMVMNRKNIVRTTSITSILSGNGSMQIRYEDMLNGSIEQERLLSSLSNT